MTTWLWLPCIAACDRWHKPQRRDKAADVTAWLGEMRRLPARELGPVNTRKRPGQRYVGRHRAVPNEPVRRPS